MPRPVAIPFPLSSAPGATTQESAGRLINCYAEPLGKTGPALAVWRRCPGLSNFAITDQAGFRGGILNNDLVYLAFSGSVRTLNSAGVIAVVAALAGTKRVTWARNNASPPDLVVVDVDNGAFLVTAGAVTSYSGAGALPAPIAVCAQDGYLFFAIGDNRVFAAGPNTTVLSANTFVTIQSRPTGALLRVIPYSGLLFAFCTKFTEIWNNTANAFPGFPYSRFNVIDRGLLGRNAIAGWEDGFGALHWVADDFGVYRLSAALTPEKVSPPDLDRLIKAVSNTDNLEASCYVHAGHSIWALTHTGTPAWTWEFNLGTQQWNERVSFRAGLYSKWRAVSSVAAFNKWLTGDTESGNILTIDDTSYREVTSPLLFRIESGPVVDFPNRIRVARADFNVVPGVGIATGADSTFTNPKCEISWTDDGGDNWANPLLRELGAQAHARQRIYALNLGMSGPMGRRWRFDVADPVYAAIMGATMSADPRAN